MKYAYRAVCGLGWLLCSVAVAKPLVIQVGGKDGISPLSALEKISQQRAADPLQAIDVVVTDGVYELERPMVMEARHGGSETAPVRWLAAPGAKPVLSGGKQLSGFHADGSGLWKLTLPEGVAAFDQLWVNGQRAQRARHPNQGFLMMQSVAEEMLGEDKARQTLRLPAEAVAQVAALDQSEFAAVQLLAYHKWDNTRRFLETARADGTITTTGKSMKSWNRWDNHTGVVLENYRAALDQEGEWFVDTKRVLHYKPRKGEAIEKTTCVVPRLSQLLVIRGTAEQPVKYISWEGIRFLHTGWICPSQGFEPQQAAASQEGVIQLDYADSLSFSSCEIAHTGIYGIWFRKACQRNVVSQCWLHDLGAGGLRSGTMELPANAAEVSKGQIFDNNIITAAGKVFPCAVGVWIGHSSDNVVSKNVICHMPYTAISVGWRWGYDASEAKRNRIDYNHIHHIGDGLLSDMGAVYTLGPSEGTVIRNNHIHDVVSFTYGGWGLYNDEGSTGIVMENNLVHHTKSGSYHQHYGQRNMVRNNIFAFASEQQLQFTRPEEHQSFTMLGNIILWEKGPLYAGNGWQKGLYQASKNLYWRMDGTDPGTLPGEKGSVHADPKFLNPTKGDWRFADDGAAKQIGFQSFDPSKAGVYGDASWIEKAKQLDP